MSCMPHDSGYKSTVYKNIRGIWQFSFFFFSFFLIIEVLCMQHAMHGSVNRIKISSWTLKSAILRITSSRDYACIYFLCFYSS